MARNNRAPKKISPSQRFARAILREVFQIIYWCVGTTRFRNNADIGEPCVMAVFHDELLPLLCYFKHKNVTAIASQNHVGYSIAQVAKRYGYEIALGSPSRGGKDAFVKLMDAARRGRTIAFAVDGSRGPRHKMKPGAVVLAKRSGLPLYLVRLEYQGRRIESAWDKSKLPRLFTDAYFHVERFPLENYSDNEIEQAVADSETALKNLLADDYQPK